MENISSVSIAALGAAIPLLHFIYSIIRDIRQTRRKKPSVRICVTTRIYKGEFGLDKPMKCISVSNVSGSLVSVIEVRRSQKHGTCVIPINGGRHDIAPNCSEDFLLPSAVARMTGSKVFVELGTGEVFPATI